MSNIKNKNAYVVYCHTNKANGKKYVGITSQKPNERWGKNGIGYKKCTYFYTAIQKYGWDGFTHEIMFEGLTKEEAEAKEIELIAEGDLTNKNTGYNLCEGGRTNVPNKETRDKLSSTVKQLYQDEPWLLEEKSKSMKQLYQDEPWRIDEHSKTMKKLFEDKPNKREECRKRQKKLMEEHPEYRNQFQKWEQENPELAKEARKKCMEAAFSPEVIAKRKVTRKKTLENPEVRANLGMSIKQAYIDKPELREKAHQKGVQRFIDEPWRREAQSQLMKQRYKDNPEALQKNREHLAKMHALRCKPVRCVETNVTYLSVAEAARQMSISASGIHSVLKGLQNTSSGYHWEYVNK